MDDITAIVLDAMKQAGISVNIFCCGPGTLRSDGGLQRHSRSVVAMLSTETT
jgi:hypothetical protein